MRGLDRQAIAFDLIEFNGAICGSIVNLRDVVHGGFEVVGPGNLPLFAVHAVDKGKPLYDLVK